MILTIDIGNSTIAVSLHQKEDGKTLLYEQMKTDKKKPEDSYYQELVNILRSRKIPLSSVKKAGLSSVVASLTVVFERVLTRLTGEKPFILTSEARLPFAIRVDDPSTVGTDLLADVTGALLKYPAPLVVFSLGTATVTLQVSEEPALENVFIYPGVNTSLRTLSAKADALPDIDIDHPGPFSGKNTNDSMVSGIVYGTAAMLDGMIDRIEKETGKTCTCVASGGLAHVICPYTEHLIHVEETLLVDGLFEALRLNGFLS
ncbi:MAG: type III pantothenate kinase [Lachnospiraceae bacterium]|nr:type III pantothenate kinase [Lachnospiraceae bacterium]